MPFGIDPAARRIPVSGSGTAMSAKILILTVSVLFLATVFAGAEERPKTVPRLGILSPSSLFTQEQTKRIPRVGWLSVRHGPRIDWPFKQAMRELGWFDGENIDIVTRFASERYDQLPKLAAELVQLNVSVIVAADSTVIRAAKNASRTIPIVMSVVKDPVASGYVASFARPGGNITGLSNNLGPLHGKRLQILREAVPTLSRVGFLAPRGSVDWKTMESLSRKLGVEAQGLPFQYPGELETLFKTVQANRTNGLVITAGPSTNLHRRKIIEFASLNRIPAIYPLALYVAEGGLMSYGPNRRLMHKRAAYFVDHILKGAKPADLPVERPMAAEFAINLKAAEAIRINLPTEVLQRADKVIR